MSGPNKMKLTLPDGAVFTVDMWGFDKELHKIGEAIASGTLLRVEVETSRELYERRVYLDRPN